MGRKNKNTSKTQRKEARLQKARQWIRTYNGTPKHMARNYRKKFHAGYGIYKDEEELLESLES